MLTFLMIGQSNMAGRGELGALPPIVNEHVRMLRDGEWLTAKEPVNPDRVFSGESLQLPFGDEVARATGEDVGLIPCAEGGTLIKEWQPGGWLLERAIAQAQLAQKTAPLSAILWIQGENDGYSEENALAYTGKFLTMLDALMAGIPAPKDLPVIVAELCPFLDNFNAQVTPDKAVPYHALISEQLRNLEKLRANIRCVRTQGLTGKPDQIHYDAASLRVLGKRFADAYLGR